jgi:hypothetical protein
MKKQLLALVLSIFAMTNVLSQPIREGFEGSFPPEDWIVEGTWITSNYRYHEGTTSAYVTDGAVGGRLIMPVFSATDATILSFYMGVIYPGYANLTTLTIEVATSLEQATWQTVATINYPTQQYEFEYREVSLAEYAGQDIYVCFHVVNNNGAGTLIDEVFLGSITCPNPTALTATPTISSANITWTGSDNANSYELQIISADQTWDDAETISVVGLSYQATGLQPATMYYVRVRSVCGNDDISNWTERLLFTTLCLEELTLPYMEEFAHLNCWTLMQTADNWDGIYPRITEGFMDNSDDNNVLLSTVGNTIIANNLPIRFDYLETEIRIKTRAFFDIAPTLLVGYVTSLTDTTTFVPLNTLTITNQIGWSEYALNTTSWNLIEGTDYYLAIKCVLQNEWDNVYIDNIYINTIPECPAPERGSVSVVANGDNAVVSWIDNNEEHEAWIVYYKPLSAEEWLTSEASEQTHTLTGLTPETTYQVYVMTDCGIEDNTEQTYTVQFTTTGIPITLPYFQNFEDTTAVSEISFWNSDGFNKWAIGNATGYIPQGSSETTGGAMYISNDNGQTYGYINTIWDISVAGILVYFTPGYEYELSFDYKVGGEEDGDNLKLFVLEPGFPLDEYWNGQMLSSELYGVYNWAHFNYEIPESWIGTTKQILFCWHNDYSGGTQPAAIDNIRISQSTCIRPGNITLDQVTQNTATISWEAEADNYTIRYRVSGSNEEFMEETTSLTYTTLTNLQPASIYEYTIQSICGEETSPLTEVATFSTSCGAIEGLWFEDFESVLYDELLANNKFACWEVLNSTTESFMGTYPRIDWNGSYDAAHSGLVSLEFNGNGLLALPQFAADLNTLQLTFYANTTASFESQAGLFEVGYITNLQDTSSFVPIATVAPVGYDRSESVMVGPFQYGNIEETEGRIALRYTSTNQAISWNLDDFTVEPIPTCPSPIPTSVTATNITTESAIITWIDPDIEHTQWIVYYKAEGEENYTTITVTDQLAELSGLTQATNYTLYVQTDCGTSDNLSQTIPITFSTKAVPITTFPYYQDFEDLVALPFNAEYKVIGNNKWVVGNATGVLSETNNYGESNSLYISNTNGQTHNYDQYSITDAYVIVPITFGSDAEYTISFDYKVIGESTDDYLSVVIADTNTILTTGIPNGTPILNLANGIDTWTNFIYSSPLLSNTTKNLIFYWTNDSGGSYGIPAAIDNLSITSSNCISPTAFETTSTTSTQATFTWIDQVNTSWILYYKAEGETEYSNVLISTNPYTLTDLEPATTYTAYLVSNCEGVESATTPIITFSTNCLPVTEFPITEGFESQYLSICWSKEVVSGSMEWTISHAYNIDWNHDPIPPVEGEQFVFYKGSSGSASRLISPVMDITTLEHPSLKFSHLAVAWTLDINELKVQYRTSPNEQWVDLIQYTTEFSEWTEDSIALPNPSQTYQIAFLATYHYGYGVGVDAVTVYDAENEIISEPEVTLGEVNTLNATAVGNTSATLNGTLVSTGNTENFTVGFTLATTVSDLLEENSNVQNITATLNDNTFSQAVTDLEGGQTYFYLAYITNEVGIAYGTIKTFTLSSLADELANELQVNLYPNPAQDDATMEIVGLDQDAKIVISDLQGRILSQNNIDAGTTRYTVNVSNLASGVYYIRIVTDKAVSTQKLIVE